MWASGDLHTQGKQFKSLHDLSYGPDEYNFDSHANTKMCTHKPKSPMNAAMKCTLKSNSCKATCLKDYSFPNGETTLPIICQDGEWTELPSCERKYRAWTNY